MYPDGARSVVGGGLRSFDAGQQSFPSPVQQPGFPVKKRPQPDPQAEGAYGTVIKEFHSCVYADLFGYLNSEVIMAAIEIELLARLMISVAPIPEPFGGLEGTTISQPGAILGQRPPFFASGNPLA